MRAPFIYQFIVSVGSRHVRSAVCCFQAHVLYKLNIKWLPRSHTLTHTHPHTPLLEVNEKGLQEQRDKKEWRPSCGRAWGSGRGVCLFY